MSHFQVSDSPSVPSWRFMCTHPAHFIAFAGGAGLSPKAPGTVGTLWAWLSWHMFGADLTPLAQFGVICFGGLLGLWACNVCTGHLQTSDPSAIVCDEVVAFWLILMVLGSASFSLQLMAFLVFRLFDAAKPPPVAWADRRFKDFGYRGAFGIMFDDLVAAACTLLVVAIYVRVTVS